MAVLLTALPSIAGVPTPRLVPLPPPPRPDGPQLRCSAPRTPFGPETEKQYEHVVEATVIGAPLLTGQDLRARVRIERFLKGRFKPSTVELLFSIACGWGGKHFFEGSRLTLYIRLIPRSGATFIGTADYWMPATPGRE